MLNYVCNVKNKAKIGLKTVQNVYMGAKNEKLEEKNGIFDMEIVQIRGSWKVKVHV